ncbi:DMT family transporter [Acerihabitans arboris]|uniref:EamA family transporter n=1 Tax=Acerihabitans arboris TaxID=2691583 RepID=A0A845SIY5_9GAMM|nr:DMT family transporter [Acerihabitans arboris]NDL62986.1 EamA family transporter [Acerihabitans arboris]
MNKRHALVSLNIAAFFFGLSGILGKVIAISPAAIVFGRALFAVLALSLLMLGLRGFRWERISRKSALVVIGASVILAGHWLTFFISVKAAGVAIATLGFASFPAFTTLFESLGFRERISLPEVMLIALICLGLIMVCPSFDLGSGNTRGFLWGILSGALLALLIICNRVTAVSIRPVQAALCQNVVISLLMLPFAFHELALASAGDWFYLALLGIFCTGVAHSLMVTSLRFVKARAAAVFFALEPVYAILFAWGLFNERPTLRMFAGAALIILSVTLFSRKGKKSAAAAA